MKPNDRNGKTQGKTQQAQTPAAGPDRRAAARKKKRIIIAVVAVVLAAALIVGTVIVVRQSGTEAPTVTTTYRIDEVTSGSVSTTISGSDSLTPIRSVTLTAVDLLEETETETEEESETETETEAEVETEVETEVDAGEQTAEEPAADGQKAEEPAGEEAEAVKQNTAENTAGTAEADTKTSSVFSGDFSAMSGAGMGTLPAEPDVIVEGIIKDVKAQAGDTVAEGDVIAVIWVSTDELTDDGEPVRETHRLLAPFDAVILEWYLHEGDDIADDTSVAMFMSTEGYSMTIAVDENNISSVAIGQEVRIDIDAGKETMPTGLVSDISYNGSKSGSTTSYKITVTFDYVAGTYPGMTVSAEIVIEDSGEGLLVPVSAVQTSGDTKYVYLAPSGAAVADVYEEGGINTSKLTKVTVTTGMSDGSYIIAESDDLSVGTLIVVPSRTSTQTGSDSENAQGNGGFPGGNFPGGGDFGNFDPSQFGGGFPGGGNFGDFDPSQFGGGGFPFAN